MTPLRPAELVLKLRTNREYSAVPPMASEQYIDNRTRRFGVHAFDVATMDLRLSHIVLMYLVASVTAFVAYALDKHAARRGLRRTPERTLHLIEFLGGWPGALLAQQWFRHKTRDRRFRVVFFSIVGVHLAVWLWLLVR